MDMKVSKATLLVLIVILVVSYVTRNIIYGKVLKATRVGLTHVIQKQNVEMQKLTNNILAKQKELDKVKKELDSIKNELNDANKKSSALITVAPEAATK